MNWKVRQEKVRQSGNLSSGKGKGASASAPLWHKFKTRPLARIDDLESYTYSFTRHTRGRIPTPQQYQCSYVIGKSEVS